MVSVTRTKWDEEQEVSGKTHMKRGMREKDVLGSVIISLIRGSESITSHQLRPCCCIRWKTYTNPDPNQDSVRGYVAPLTNWKGRRASRIVNIVYEAKGSGSRLCFCYIAFIVLCIAYSAVGRREAMKGMVVFGWWRRSKFVPKWWKADCCADGKRGYETQRAQPAVYINK